ncbi:glycosyltransferase involved in cell wall biosynthesis [Candidatus Pelagibacter ubique HIMB4]
MPSIEKGGVEKNFFIVSNFLSKKFNKISVISISKKYKGKFNKSINLISLNSNCWDKCSRRIKFLLSLFLLIKEILKNRNTLVFSFQANIYTIFICKIFSIKNIVRCNSSPTGWSKNFFKQFLYKFYLNKADKVMVNSKEFKRELKKKFNVNSICIYNPLDTKEIINKSKISSRKIFKNKKLKILNIGRCTEQKDQITFLRSLTKIKNKISFHAVIIGEGLLRKKLENFVYENNLKNHVTIENFKSNPYPFIKQSDLFILSSKYEGLPNVILEAIVLKKFVISSACPTGPKEILLNGKGGFLFKVGNYEQLTKKIIFFKNNKSKCKLMTKKLFKSLKRFDYNKNLNKYFDLVNKYI